MDLLGEYDSNSEDENATGKTTATEQKAQRADRRFLRAAPSISIMTRRKHGHELIVHNDPSNRDVLITEPVQGPQVEDPSRAQKNQLARFDLEKNAVIDEASFAKQRKQFQRTGQALGPDEKTTVVRTTLGYNSDRLRLFEEQERERQKRQRELYGSDDDTGGGNGEGKKKSKKKAKEPLVYGSDDEAVYGVWAPPSKEERWHADNALTDIQKGGIESLAPEQISEREYIKERDRLLGEKEEEREEISGFERLMERKMAHLLPPKTAGDDRPMEPTKTTFHGESETDYKGRSWMAPPTGMASILSLSRTVEEEMDDHKCFVPKKCVHRYTGHNKGVQRIRLFPKTGHLLLSAGLDGKCKVWSVGEPGQRRVLRTYEGHKAAVRDVQFNHDGSRFVSASFDRFLRLWDTESGRVLQTFGNKKVPYCVEFYPKDDNFFVVGTSDNKIVTYDCTTAEITQEYNHHLAPVNAVAFVEEDNGNVKMISSSDDKKVLVWEWDIGVPIKYVSDPTMHSMPCLVLHPSHQYLVGQSLDNNIVCFQVGQKFKLSKKKKFSGHQVAGYACEPSFSPDGRFLVSGDGKGKMFVWDWKMQKILQKFRAHESGPTIACVWHPINPSMVFTCGWDGVIKMWQQHTVLKQQPANYKRQTSNSNFWQGSGQPSNQRNQTPARTIAMKRVWTGPQWASRIAGSWQTSGDTFFYASASAVALAPRRRWFGASRSGPGPRTPLLAGKQRSVSPRGGRGAFRAAPAFLRGSCSCRCNDGMGARRLSTEAGVGMARTAGVGKGSNHSNSNSSSNNNSTTEDDPCTKIYNTMTGSLESLPPSTDPSQLGLGWYTCGPTTYAPAHLGHARTYVCLDILRRVVVASANSYTNDGNGSEGGKTTPEPLFVLNITDVDDKTLAAAQDSGEDPLLLARRYEREFWRDWDALNCLRPHVVTRVTEHVDSDIVPFIERLVEKGMAYELRGTGNEEDDGGVYFDVRAYNEKLGHLTRYGKLAPPAASHGVEDIFRNNATGGGGEPAPPEVPPNQKRDPRDFVLWKTRKRGREALSWSSPWGDGRPGWHIECSAMIESVQEKFRDSHRFLVHAGGIDLKFPHHTNEIAQSEAYLGVGKWIPHWIHTGHLHIDGLKMSKSLKNFVSIEDFLNGRVSSEHIDGHGDGHDDSSPAVEDERGGSGAPRSTFESPSDDFRLWCLGLSGSYRGPATFSMARIGEARSVRHKIVRFLLDGETWVRDSEDDPDRFSRSSKKWSDDACAFFGATDRAKKRGLSALENDLNGSAFLSELLAIADEGTKYMQRGDARPAEPLVSALREVRTLLRLVGFTETTTEAGVRTEAAGDRSGRVCGEALADCLVRYRSAVRAIALGDLSSSGRKQLLALSDELRDSVLPELGVRVIDGNRRDETGDGWKFCLPRTTSSDRTESIPAKDGKPSSSSSRRSESSDLGSIPIGEFFKTGQYEGNFLAYTEDGIPTHNADGSEVSKRLLKKLLKKREKHRSRLEKQNRQN